MFLPKVQLLLLAGAVLADCASPNGWGNWGNWGGRSNDAATTITSSSIGASSTSYDTISASSDAEKKKKSSIKTAVSTTSVDDTGSDSVESSSVKTSSGLNAKGSTAVTSSSSSSSSTYSSNNTNNIGLAGSVGPLTDIESKTTICDITDYGAVSDNSTDISTAITDAFDDCVKGTTNSRLYIPEGNYLLSNPVILSGGSAWAFQIEGLITCAYSTSNWGASSYNTAIVVKNTDDFEMYSETGKGAIQGNGYIYRTTSGEAHDSSWMRLVRIVNTANASIHDLILVDSPMYHLVVYECTNVEVYHITVRGANTGMTDAIDISGYNYYVHHIEATGKDECVSIKSPSINAEVSEIVCSNSGGISIGSLQSGANISNILVSNVVNYYTNSLMFIKTKPDGSGSVSNCEFKHFKGYNCAYGIDLDQYWDSDSGSGNVQLENLVFSDFSGSIAAAYSDDSPTRGAIRIIGAYDEVATGITLEDIVMYKNEDADGMFIDVYENAFGSGYYLKSDSEQETTYTTSVTATAAPTVWTQPSLPDWNVGTDGYGTTQSIPVYTPAVLWTPGSNSSYYDSI